MTDSEKLTELADWMQGQIGIYITHPWMSRPKISPDEVRDIAHRIEINAVNDNSGSDKSFMEEFSDSQSRFLNTPNLG